VVVDAFDEQLDQVPARELPVIHLGAVVTGGRRVDGVTGRGPDRRQDAFTTVHDRPPPDAPPTIGGTSVPGPPAAHVTGSNRRAGPAASGHGGPGHAAGTPGVADGPAGTPCRTPSRPGPSPYVPGPVPGRRPSPVPRRRAGRSTPSGCRWRPGRPR